MSLLAVSSVAKQFTFIRDVKKKPQWNRHKNANKMYKVITYISIHIARIW